MLSVALISQKGGAGKTTLACALAVAAVRTGLSTVLVDLDPQRSAATWHLITHEAQPAGRGPRKPGSCSRIVTFQAT